jgi:hypothetical protein
MDIEEKRSGMDRRSNWRDALETLNRNRSMLDSLLMEIQGELSYDKSPDIEMIRSWKTRLNRIIQVSRM